VKPDCDEKVGRACCRRHKSKDEDDDEDEDEHEAEHEQEEEGPGGTRYVSDMGIKPRAATSIAMDLGHIESLDILYIGDAGATALAVGLQANSTLETLDMGSNGVSSHGVCCIGAALMRNTSLRVWKLSFNGIGDQKASLPLIPGATPHSKGVEQVLL